MRKEGEPNDITRKSVVYTHPDMNAVTVRQDIGYLGSKDDSLTLDLYSPPDLQRGTRKPAVVLVSGYPDPGYEAVLGCRQKEMAACVSWGRLLAASGLVAVTYSNEQPARDLDALLRYLELNASTLGIDESRIGMWACSGNVPLALSALMQSVDHTFGCAVLCYGYMLDLGGATTVAEAAARFGFVTPAAAASLDPLRNQPLLVVRAGKDAMPGLNETIDRFLGEALARNLPVTLVNHYSAPHAFDLLDDSESSHEVIRQILAFLRFHLSLQDAPA